MTEPVHVFVYDTGRIADVDSELVREDAVAGTLLDVPGVGIALMLAGGSRVPGEVRRISTESLASMDERARVAEGLFRRVGVQVGDTPCWVWVAGPSFAQRLARGVTRPGGHS